MKWISTKGKYQRKHKPVRNWIPILLLLAVSSVGAIMAVRGILREQNRQEKYDLISSLPLLPVPITKNTDDS